MFSNLEFASPSLSEKEHYSGAQSQSSSIPIHPHQEDAEALAHDLLSKGGGERQQRRSWWTSGSIWPLVIVALVTAIVVGAAVGGTFFSAGQHESSLPATLLIALLFASRRTGKPTDLRPR